MDNKLRAETDGTSRVDLKKVDLSAQTRMFSGGADSQSTENVLSEDDFLRVLEKVSRQIRPQPDEGKTQT